MSIRFCYFGQIGKVGENSLYQRLSKAILPPPLRLAPRHSGRGTRSRGHIEQSTMSKARVALAPRLAVIMLSLRAQAASHSADLIKHHLVKTNSRQSRVIETKWKPAPNP
jgi:hypothetical protein